jgi:hypothetical protein
LPKSKRPPSSPPHYILDQQDTGTDEKNANFLPSRFCQPSAQPTKKKQKQCISEALSIRQQ